MSLCFERMQVKDYLCGHIGPCLTEAEAAYLGWLEVDCFGHQMPQEIPAKSAGIPIWNWLEVDCVNFQ